MIKEKHYEIENLLHIGVSRFLEPRNSLYLALLRRVIGTVLQ